MATENKPATHQPSAVDRRSNPFSWLQHEIDRLFTDFEPDLRAFPRFESGALTPKMDVSESDDEIVMTAELPGMEEKDVEINYADGVLTVRGEKKAEKEDKKKDYRVVERSYGSFSRSMRLPEGVDPGKIDAAMSKGVLTVKVPKPEPKVAHKIDVKPSA